MKVTTCGSEEFRCSSSLCIPLSWQCDGEIDCPGGLDEWEQICSELELTISGLDFISFLQRSVRKRNAIAENLNVNLMERASLQSGGRSDIIELFGDLIKLRCDSHEDCKDGADEEHCSKSAVG